MRDDEQHGGAAHPPCCAPSSPRANPVTAAPLIRAHAQSGSDEGMMLLPGGAFRMGTEDPEGFPQDGEGPVREVRLHPFWIDATAVTNDQFTSFVTATGYVTDAERAGWSFVFGGLLTDDFPETRGVAQAPWWREVVGATWRRPEGPQSSIEARMDHPVVHVSWNDALAFCAWSGKQLPTEAEWEYAARGGLEQRRYPWGDELTPGGTHMCNIWQGDFPSRNTRDDGYLGTSPASSFQPNGFGLYNVAGNVWEWCADWFHPTFHRGAPADNPAGPPAGEARIIRGGSYLCHRSYCNRYRVAARSFNTPDSTTGNTGFRCARDAER